MEFVRKVDCRGFCLIYKGTVRRGDDNRFEKEDSWDENVLNLL